MGGVMPSFRVLSNPFTGEHIVFTETADTTGGEFVRFDWRGNGTRRWPAWPLTTSPPVWLQDIVLPPLWLLAKIVGRPAYYDHWDSRTDNSDEAGH